MGKVKTGLKYLHIWLPVSQYFPMYFIFNSKMATKTIISSASPVSVSVICMCVCSHVCGVTCVCGYMFIHVYTCQPQIWWVFPHRVSPYHWDSVSHLSLGIADLAITYSQLAIRILFQFSNPWNYRSTLHLHCFCGSKFWSSCLQSKLINH